MNLQQKTTNSIERFLGGLLPLFFFWIGCVHAQNPESVFQIIAAGNSTLYVKGDDLFRVTARENRIVLSEIPSLVQEDFKKANFAYDIAEIDDYDNLWLLLPTYLVCYARQKNEWQVFALPGHVKDNHYGMSPIGLEYWKESIWVATSEYLWCFHLEKKWWEQFSYPQGHHGGIIKKGPGGSLWLDGIAWFDGKEWEALPRCPIPLSFWPRTSQCFTWDKNGYPWLAAVQGVYFFDMHYKCWRSAPGERFQRAYSIACFKDEIWCTDYNKALYKFTGSSWQEVSCPTPRPKLSYAYTLYSTQDRL